MLALSRRRWRSLRYQHHRIFIALPIVLIGGIGLGLFISLHQAHSPRKIAADATPLLAPADPVRISIPKLHLNASLEQVALAPDRTMSSPTGPDKPAWYDLGPRPGAKGNAVIAGHLDGQNFAPAVFFHLRDLAPGDDIVVTDQHSSKWRFRVDHAQAYDTHHAPLTEIFGAASTPHLNLITCAGSWDRNRQQYDDRLVVYATAVH